MKKRTIVVLDKEDLPDWFVKEIKTIGKVYHVQASQQRIIKMIAELSMPEHEPQKVQLYEHPETGAGRFSGRKLLQLYHSEGYTHFAEPRHGFYVAIGKEITSIFHGLDVGTFAQLSTRTFLKLWIGYKTAYTFRKRVIRVLQTKNIDFRFGPQQLTYKEALKRMKWPKSTSKKAG